MHFGIGLGAVEMTSALDYSYNRINDLIVFDSVNQHILTVAPYHPQKEIIWRISRRKHRTATGIEAVGL